MIFLLKYKFFFHQLSKNYLLFFLFLLTGCSSYEPLYIDEASLNKELPVPEEKQIVSMAKHIEHPLLKPVKINFTNGISPGEAAIIAVLVNPSLKTERDRQKLASAQVIQAGILPNPQLSFSYEIPSGGPKDGTSNAYGIGFEWEITSLLARGAKLLSAKSNVKAVALNIAWKEWQVAESARMHWFRLYWTLKKKKLLEHWISQMERRVRILKRAVDQGIETEPALSSAKTSLLEIQAALSKNREEICKEKLTLKRIMGLPSTYKLILQKIDFYVPLSKGLMKKIDLATKDIEKHRLDLLALKESCKSSDNHLRAIIFSQFPKINIGIIHARDTGNIITIGPSVTLEIPIFDRRQGQIAIARASRQKALDEYLTRIFETQSNMAQIKIQIKCLEKHFKKVASAVAARKKLVQIYYKALSYGNADILTYYQALDKLIQRKIDLVNTKMNISELVVAMESVTGTYIYSTDS